MNSPSSKWIEAISALNDLTQTGEVKWETTSHLPSTPPTRGGLLFAQSATVAPYALSGVPYVASYNGKKLRLSKFTVPQDEMLRGLISSALDVDESYALEILSADMREIYRVPAAIGLRDLFRSVERQASGVDELLHALLEHGNKSRI